MITLITGLPGNGKTLYALQYVADLAKRENRPVWYHNITGLSAELGWHAIPVLAEKVNGKEFELDGTELTARCMLHETDHCDGIVFLDKMTPLKRELVKRRIKKLQKAGEWPS